MKAISVRQSEVSLYSIIPSLDVRKVPLKRSGIGLPDGSGDKSGHSNTFHMNPKKKGH